MENMENRSATRSTRMIIFKREILPALDPYDVRSFNRGTMFKINDDRYGVIDIYPMADRLLILGERRWVSNARKWIIKNIFRET